MSAAVSDAKQAKKTSDLHPRLSPKVSVHRFGRRLRVMPGRSPHGGGKLLRFLCLSRLRHICHCYVLPINNKWSNPGTPFLDLEELVMAPLKGANVVLLGS